MALHAFLNSPTFTWGVLPVLIFLSRICDVSIGTVRVIFIARGFRWYAAILGFFEVLIWLTAISQIMKNLNNPICYLGYASGYAMGTFVGVWLEGKLSLGKVILRVITQGDAHELIAQLRMSNYPVVRLDAQVEGGQAQVIFSVVRRQELRHLISQIQSYAPGACYSVEDIRLASAPGFPWPHMHSAREPISAQESLKSSCPHP